MSRVRNRGRILDSFIDSTSYADATRTVLQLAAQGWSGYVCAANVHMVMEGHADPDFQRIVNEADLVTPDGMPLVWLLRRRGHRNQRRVYGPTLMLWVCAAAAIRRIPIGLYGGSEHCLERLVPALQRRFPGLDIVYRHSPPFRPLSAAEDAEIISHIQASDVRILFVGLGCPKQERWMAQHRDRIPAVQIGVGAAFNFHAGLISQAPAWLQGLGLEWLHRLFSEPRRLWWRYCTHNPRFAGLALRQLLRDPPWRGRGRTPPRVPVSRAAHSISRVARSSHS